MSVLAKVLQSKKDKKKQRHFKSNIIQAKRQDKANAKLDKAMQSRYGADSNSGNGGNGGDK